MMVGEILLTVMFEELFLFKNNRNIIFFPESRSLGTLAAPEARSSATPRSGRDTRPPGAAGPWSRRGCHGKLKVG